MDELKLNDNTLQLIHMIQDKDDSSKALRNNIEGYYTCTRFVLERIHSNIVEHQISEVGHNSDSYDIKTSIYL